MIMGVKSRIRNKQVRIALRLWRATRVAFRRTHVIGPRRAPGALVVDVAGVVAPVQEVHVAHVLAVLFVHDSAAIVVGILVQLGRPRMGRAAFGARMGVRKLLGDERHVIALANVGTVEDDLDVLLFGNQAHVGVGKQHLDRWWRRGRRRRERRRRRWGWRGRRG